MERIQHKRGDTFAPTMQYFEADGKTPASLVGVTIRSHLRDGGGNLAQNFIVNVTNAALGQYAITPIATANMGLGVYQWDIEYTQNGLVDHTDTIEFELVKTITR